MKRPAVYRIASLKELPAAIHRMPAVHRRFIVFSSDSSEQVLTLESAGFHRLAEPSGLPDAALLEQGYCDLIAHIGSRKSGLSWWATTLSEKNEHLSLLYRDLVACVTFCRTLELCTGRENVLIVCSQPLADQVSVFCRRKGISFSDCSSYVARVQEFFVKWVKAVARPARFCLAIWRRMYYVRYVLGKKIFAGLESLAGKRVYVIRSFIDERIGKYDSFAYNPFFGSLPMHVAKRGFQPLIFAEITAGFERVVRILKEKQTVPVVPEEYFLHWSDAIASVMIAGQSARLDKNAEFCGVDVSVLLEEELASSTYTMYTARNVLTYYAAYRLASAITFDVYIQTYENYAWEKMMILGLRAAGSRALLLGFQHAFVCRASFKYFLGTDERERMPLPDRIITLGSRTKAILEERGNYPRNRLVAGCALRQGYLHQQSCLTRCRQKRLIVPLTMVPEECRRIVRFVLASGLTADWQVNFRCHPCLPRSGFDTGQDEVLAPGISFDNALPVLDELARSAVLAYTWSTVAVEALYLGTPVVYLDILQPLRVDPLFECSDLKRTACLPVDLAHAARDFYDMNDRAFENERKSARSYLEEYFYPVTEENLRCFLRDTRE